METFNQKVQFLNGYNCEVTIDDIMLALNREFDIEGAFDGDVLIMIIKGNRTEII